MKKRGSVSARGLAHTHGVAPPSVMIPASEHRRQAVCHLQAAGGRPGIQQVYLTSGEDDVLIIVDSPNGDNVAKFALALGSQGNVRTRTARAWPESEFQKLISELP